MPQSGGSIFTPSWNALKNSAVLFVLGDEQSELSVGLGLDDVSYSSVNSFRYV